MVSPVPLADITVDDLTECAFPFNTCFKMGPHPYRFPAAWKEGASDLPSDSRTVARHATTFLEVKHDTEERNALIISKWIANRC